jgi:dihydrofolate synthase / folylpolyglutamate synthase
VPAVDEGAARSRRAGIGATAPQPAGAGVTTRRSRQGPASPPSQQKSRSKSLASVVERLFALHPKRIDLSLGRIQRLLAALDHPERRLPPVIHVAGTNGKGSTVAFARAIVEAAGKLVHVYTSPNLVRLNERFRIAQPGGGQFAGDAELADALAECEAKNAGAPITVFEVETAAAFVLFSRHPADVVLLEVGLGGRLDATNVVERPLASIITRVSLDHREFLGDSIEQIAAEKAGILKAAVPAIISGQSRAALEVIERRAARLRAPLFIAGEDWTATEERGRLVYQDDGGLLDLPPPRLYGRHQYENAGAAIAALRAAGLQLPAAAFEQGMIRVDWPARMQRLSQGRLTALIPAESELWLDGGHNADGGRAIAAALADLEERVSRPLVLIVAMLSTKDSTGFLKNFAGLARRVITVPMHQDKAVPAPELAEIAGNIGIPAMSRDGLESALAVAGNLDLHPAPRILITGSLYLAGEVLALNGTPPQ